MRALTFGLLVLVAVVSAAPGAGCGEMLEPEPGPGEAGAGPSETPGPSPGVPWLDGAEVDVERLADWVRAGGYQVWARSPAAFRSTAGGGSRIYVNEVLARSLEAGAAHHPAGAVAVREVTFDDLMTLRGVNVTVKLEASNANADAGPDGDGDDDTRWFFVELYDLRPGGVPTVAERGAQVCLGCHAPAPDAVRSGWPLR